ncbi:hypothetical protein [Enterovirga sp. CN4-39]|uniref:hypothetical protein n=1 Tax=Enterovirga sp. CN4-39 TaxID=3400910 RepID=UPI003BFB1F2E
MPDVHRDVLTGHGYMQGVNDQSERQMITFPKKLTPGLLAFCRSISSERPVVVRSKPHADARPSECFNNVLHSVAISGGSTAYGWAIWSIPGIYFEAEHHGVWRDDGGKLLDVSPQLRGAGKILFLPDPMAVFEPGRYRPNVIGPATAGKLAAEFVELATRRNAIRDSYRRSGVSLTTFTVDDQIELARIEGRLRQLLAYAGIS